MSVVILYRIQFEYMYNLSKSGTCDNNILSLLYVLYYINNIYIQKDIEATKYYYHMFRT